VYKGGAAAEQLLLWFHFVLFLKTPGGIHLFTGVFYYAFNILIINIIRKFILLFHFVFPDYFPHLLLEEKQKEKQRTKAQGMQGKTQLLPGILLRHANGHCAEKALPQTP
jgi:hypothetical protein